MSQHQDQLELLLGLAGFMFMNITKLEFVLRISLVEMCFFSLLAQVRLCWKVKVSNIYLSSPAHHQAPVLGGINDTIYEYVG